MSLLYAISSDWSRVMFFLQGQVPLLQLRFKDQSLSSQISRLRDLIQQFPHTRVVINDDPEIALQSGAWGVHLGQEDLDRFHVHDLQGFPAALGISTHNQAEIERALQYSPAYLGFGPMFETTTKTVNSPPQSIAMLKKIIKLVPLPIVAIGGIQPQNWQEVLQVNPYAIAMISALDIVQDNATLQRWQAELQAV